ncbi:MAG: host attachment protein [Parvularculaceae bacterium]|jgi:protein required for attachment to host cells|nr:host attachment protein [Parvularculaceae bacterium]
MAALKIEHDDLVLVADGRKALFLRNRGDAELPDLRVEEVLTGAPNPRTSEQGADRPGRQWNMPDGRRSAMESTDYHQLAEADFARSVAAALNEHDRIGKVSALVVAAPPATLADLRKGYSPSLRSKLKAEIDKDLTKHPVSEIEKLLTA